MRCIFCGRELKDPESEARGCGPVCAGKHEIARNQITIFTVEKVTEKDKEQEDHK